MNGNGERRNDDDDGGLRTGRTMLHNMCRGPQRSVNTRSREPWADKRDVRMVFLTCQKKIKWTNPKEN